MQLRERERERERVRVCQRDERMIVQAAGGRKKTLLTITPDFPYTSDCFCFTHATKLCSHQRGRFLIQTLASFPLRIVPCSRKQDACMPIAGNATVAKPSCIQCPNTMTTVATGRTMCGEFIPQFWLPRSGTACLLVSLMGSG